MNKRILTVTLNPCIDRTITLDGFCEGGLNRAIEVRTDAGGKGINVAKVLAYFGVNVTALGVMGSRGSEKILSELEKRGIHHDFYMAEGETRTNYKLYDKIAERVTEVNEPGFSLSPDDIEKAIGKIIQKLPEADVMVLAGSTAKGFSDDIYGKLTNAARKHGVKVILDADGKKLRCGIKAIPHVIKPNIAELEELYGKPFSGDGEMYGFCRSILDCGVKLIILSMGADGAVYLTAEEAWRVRGISVPCKSTVGAGDSMVAAAAYAISSGCSISELANLASAAGTVTAMKEGTEVCKLDEMIEFSKKIHKTKIW